MLGNIDPRNDDYAPDEDGSRNDDCTGCVECCEIDEAHEFIFNARRELIHLQMLLDLKYGYERYKLDLEKCPSPEIRKWAVNQLTRVEAEIKKIVG